MIKQDKKVSVIIPVYNGKKYIKETLNSILQSTYQNLEVLVLQQLPQRVALRLRKQHLVRQFQNF